MPPTFNSRLPLLAPILSSIKIQKASVHLASPPWSALCPHKHPPRVSPPDVAGNGMLTVPCLQVWRVRLTFGQWSEMQLKFV